MVWEECPQPVERLERLLAGAADVSCDLQGVGATRFAASRALVLHHVRTPTCTVFMLNLRRGPCVSPGFRRLLAASIDKERVIAEVLGGAAQPIDGPLTDMHLGFAPGLSGPVPGRQEASQALAADGGPTRITLNVPAKTPDEAPQVARRLAAGFEEVGIATDVVVHDDREKYAALVQAGEIGDAACFDSTPLSTFRVLNEKFHSQRAGPWWQGYAEPVVDDALDAARSTPDVPARRRLYQLAYRRIAHDLPWLFLYSPSRYVGTGPRVKRFETTPEGYLGLVTRG
jgi:peptide/nickel transport system substrate-binding protein